MKRKEKKEEPPEKLINVQFRVVKADRFYAIIFESNIHKAMVFYSVYEDETLARRFGEKMAETMTETGLRVNCTPIAGNRFWISKDQSDRQIKSQVGAHYIHWDQLDNWNFEGAIKVKFDEA